MFWLNGPAGTGKSTISQTLAEMCFADGRLGASFFCSRDFEDRSSLHTIFPTLAFQLAYRYPRFREELIQILEPGLDVRRESLCSQMEKLIIGPLKITRTSTLIIIDALDECKDEEPASAILSILSRYAYQIPEVKFFVTGRPEPRIHSGFRLAALRPIAEVLRLDDIESSPTYDDIRLLLRTRLIDVSKTRSDCDSWEDWPSSSDLDILCDRAAGLFIYASTAVKFIECKNHIPTERLTLITSLPERRPCIDDLYTQILEQAFKNVRADDPVFYSSFRSVVGAVLLVFNPLPKKALSDLLKVSGVPTALHSLRSLLLVPNSGADPIRVFHKSFPDFLMDPGRCKDERFFINPSVHHREILLSCLDIMKGGLRRNICDLDNYASPGKVDNLPALRKAHIGDALEYACRFWTKHLASIPGSGHGVEEVRKAIDEFFTTHLLFWIEVLILMGNLDVSVYAINDIRRWYASVSSQRFVYRSLF